MHCDAKILPCFGDNNFNLGSVKKEETLPAKPSVQSGQAPEEGAGCGKEQQQEPGWGHRAVRRTVSSTWPQVNPQGVSSAPSAAV